MDPDLANLPTPPSTSNVPYDIYLPLLQIARTGYDANDVKSWYATIQDQLLRDTYHMSTCESSSIAPVRSLDGTSSTAANTSVTERNFGPAYTIHSQTHLDLPDAFPFEAYGTNDVTTAASPLSAPSTYEAPTPTSFDYHPSPSSLPAITQAIPSTPAYSPAHFPAQINTWPHTSRYDEYDESPPKRSVSQSPRYEFPVSSIPMPFLFPSNESSPPMPTSSLAPLYTSTEVMYLPPIAIIPSRKRRKAGSKGGVKKFIQPLHVSRQSI